MSFKVSDFQTKVYDSIQSTVDDAQQEKAEKEARYEAAKANLNIFAQLRYKAMAKFDNAKKLYQSGKNTSEYLSAKTEFNSVMASYTEADNNVDILRASYEHSIFYCGKINDSAIIANAKLG